jgi:ABC-type uncharacterized transport system permease subunit
MQKRGLICFGLAVLLVVVAAISIDLDGANVLTLIMLAAAGLLFLIGISVATSTLDFDAANPLENVRLVSWILLAATGLLIVGGFTLIFIGPKADKKGEEAEP